MPCLNCSSNFRTQRIMAFVYRSQKGSPFETSYTRQQHNNDNVIIQANVPEMRLHEREPALKKKMSAYKKYAKSRKRCNQESHPSIPDKQKVFNPFPPQVKRNQKYNFRSLKKFRPPYQLNKTTDNQSDLIEKKQYYDLPGSMSQKSLVKYITKITKIQQKKAQSQNPGPGAYNPQQPSYTQTPMFREATNFSSEYLKTKDLDSVERKQQQNLFAVKYNYMNSSVFKKSLNLLKISNGALLNKLFTPKKKRKNKQYVQNVEYVKIDESIPGPGAYDQKIKQKNGSSFGNGERFKQQLTSSGSKNFYDVSIPIKQSKQINETSCFCSDVKRFSDEKPTRAPLQYTNYENSFLKKSLNKREAGFKGDLGRTEQKEVDKRPYYELSPPQKSQFLTKFNKYGAKRQLFHIKSQASPGPEDYDTSYSWRKQHSCLIKNQTNKQKVNSVPNSENSQANFYICSQQSLHRKGEKTSKGVLKSSKLSASRPVLKPQYPQKYYETTPSWQKKSFNKNFINDILPANNPIKNKIL